jgi:hypothetical protein
MLKTKIQSENSCIHYEELDEVFSEIEEELEKKLWELHDRMVNQKNS